MVKLFLLVIQLATGQPAMIVDVGLLYPSLDACEADAGRAMGVLQQILENKYGEGVLKASAHVCKVQGEPT